jgi:hypothetical protein
MFDESEHPRGHEPRRAHRRPAAGHFGDLDQPAPVRHLDPPSGAGRLDRVGAAAVTGVDDDLDPIANHRDYLFPREVFEV